MKTAIKASDTRFPSLTRSILRQLNREDLAEVARHGADAGWSGFTYHTDTLRFYAHHKADILKLAEDMASDLGEDMLAMIASFGCLKNDKLTASQIGEALYSGRGDESTNE